MLPASTGVRFYVDALKALHKNKAFRRLPAEVFHEMEGILIDGLSREV